MDSKNIFLGVFKVLINTLIIIIREAPKKFYFKMALLAT